MVARARACQEPTAIAVRVVDIIRVEPIPHGGDVAVLGGIYDVLRHNHNVSAEPPLTHRLACKIFITFDAVESR